MSEDIQDRIEQLLDEYQATPHGPSQVRIAEEAVRLADSISDEELGFDTRQMLSEAATFAGEPAKALAAFSWLLARVDERPGHFYGEDELLWHYKWVLDSLYQFPTIAREQIETTIEDFGKRLAAAGYGPNSLHKIRLVTAVGMGDLDRVPALYDAWIETPSDGNSDCHACNVNQEVNVLIARGNDQGALDRAKPLVSRRIACASVPHATFGTLLPVVMRLGDHRSAKQFSTVGRKMIGGNLPNFLDSAGHHLIYLAAVDQLDAAMRLVRKGLPALERVSPLDRFDFLLGLRQVFRRLLASGAETTRLAMPAGFPGPRTDNAYPTATLAGWTDRELTAIADAFDTRNGNDMYTSRIAATDALVDAYDPPAV